MRLLEQEAREDLDADSGLRAVRFDANDDGTASAAAAPAAAPGGFGTVCYGAIAHRSDSLPAGGGQAQ